MCATLSGYAIITVHRQWILVLTRRPLAPAARNRSKLDIPCNGESDTRRMLSDNFLRRWIDYGWPIRSILLCKEIEVRRNARLVVQRYGRDTERVFSLRHEIRLGKINCVLIKEERYLGSYRLRINYAHFCLDEESICRVYCISFAYITFYVGISKQY